jgi:formate dehydrogenase subunit gamma
MSDSKNTGAVNTAIDANHHLEGALLPILHQVQNNLGHIPADQVGIIAKALNLSHC